MTENTQQQASTVKVVEVPAAATPARMKLRHWLIFVSFLIFVATPIAGAAVYLYAYAADQYASKVGFTVRREEVNSPLEILGGLSQISGASSSDTDILYEFVQSQELVRKVDEAHDLRRIYANPKADWLFRLMDDASIEDLLDYWEQMVRVEYDPGSGLIEIEVRAFDPQDAQRVSQELLDRSSAMINQLSNIARADVKRHAKEELEQAEQRLKAARQALTLFRNETRIVDPSADIQGQMGLLSSLQSQLAEALIAFDLLTGTTNPKDPRVLQATRRIRVIQGRIEEERRKLGVADNSQEDGSVYANLIGQFESLQVDLEFAEKAYLSALTAYDVAVADARRQSRYLAAYITPTLAETPRYPQREVLLIVFSIMLLGIWTIFVLVYYSLRDRR